MLEEALSIMSLSTTECWMVLACFVLMLFDIITGLFASFANNAFDSGKMREGLMHKATLSLLIVFSVVMQAFIANIGSGVITVPTVYAVTALIIVMETGSVIENLIKAYPDLASTPVQSWFGNKDEEDSDDGDC